MGFSDLSSEAKSRAAISSLGYAGAAGAFIAPAESFLSMHTALVVATVAYVVFSFQFLFTPDFFFAENFVKPPKDNFSYLFMRMFGLMAFAFMYTAWKLPTAEAFPIFALLNGVMCYVGPQRGELLIHPNVGPKHIVPHVALLVVSLCVLGATF